jgi:hypothetical protein
MEFYFDSYRFLSEPSQVFVFRDREYKISRGKDAESNCIVSILNEEKEYYDVYRDLIIYCGCLSWENQAAIKILGAHLTGYRGRQKLDIRKIGIINISKSPITSKRDTLYIQRIPHVYNRDQEDALGLYREAIESWSPYYNFLCLWNILNIPARKAALIKKWINDARITWKDKIFPNAYVEELEKKGNNIGVFLEESCRNAIAHIRRDSPKRTHIDPNSSKDFSRIQGIGFFLSNLVEIYIREELNMKEHQFLTKFNESDIPEYLSDAEIKKKVLNR